MTNWNVGSIAEHVGNYIGWDNITSISGITLNDIVEQQINFVREYVSDNFAINPIPDKYQPSLIDLTKSQVLLSTDSQDGGTDNVSLGDLKVSSGKGSNTSIAKQLREDALNRLKILSRSIRFKKVIGG